MRWLVLEKSRADRSATGFFRLLAKTAPCRLWRKKLNRPAVSRDQATPRLRACHLQGNGATLAPPRLWRVFFDGGLSVSGSVRWRSIEEAPVPDGVPGLVRHAQNQGAEVEQPHRGTRFLFLPRRVPPSRAL